MFEIYWNGVDAVNDSRFEVSERAAIVEPSACLQLVFEEPYSVAQFDAPWFMIAGVRTVVWLPR